MLGHIYLWLAKTSNNDKKPLMTFKHFPPISPQTADQPLGQALKLIS